MSTWNDKSELIRSQQWQRRGKVFKAKTMDALKSLYGTVPQVPATPWPEPKGITRKTGKESENARSTSEDGHTEAKAQKKSHK